MPKPTYKQRVIAARRNRSLTPIEQRVLDLILVGLGNIPIAISLRTSEQVIKNTVRMIFVKKSVRSRAMLILAELKERDAKHQQQRTTKG